MLFDLLESRAPEKAFRCHMCGTQFSERQEYRHHVEEFHAKTVPKDKEMYADVIETWFYAP